jgi:hypothetical protein
MADVDLELALALRREAEAKLCAARGEASFHQDRTVYLEERVRELEGQRAVLAGAIRVTVECGEAAGPDIAEELAEDLDERWPNWREWATGGDDD